MRFLEPGYLNWLWLALLPVVLWLFRRRARRVQVSTLLFFRSLAREHQESAWLRQVKRWLSLLLTLLVMTGVILALAKPANDSGESGAVGLVLVLDASASMSAGDGKTTRVDKAKDMIRARVNAAKDSVVMSLVTFANDADVLLSRSRNKRELLRLLDAVKPVPAEGQPVKAWSTALRLAKLDAPAEIYHAGDCQLTGKQESQVTYVWKDVAESVVTNAGITGFNLRAAPLERNRYEAFLRVMAASGNATEVTSSLEVKIGGRLVQVRELKLGPGQEESLLLPLEGVDGEKLDIRLKTPNDTMGMDDVLLATLPAAKPLTVAWLAQEPDPFTELALGTLVEAGRVEMWKGGPDQWPLKDKPDVVVLENWLPSTGLPEVPMVLLSPVGGSSTWIKTEALRGMVPVDHIRSLSPLHAVVHGVPATRLSVTQTVGVTAGGVGLEKIWLGGDQALLLAGEINGLRAVVTTFAPGKSESLALQPAYPLLLANAIYWCAENADGRSGLRAGHVGDVVQAKGDLRWETWDGRAQATMTQENVSGAAVLPYVGLWEAGEGRRGYSVLASKEETDLRRAETSTDPGTSRQSALAFGGGSLLLWAVLGIVLLESWLFHRTAVY